MRIITDSGNYALCTDSMNVWIERIYKSGRSRNVSGYCRSFSEALKSLARARIMASEADSLKYLLTEAISIESQLDDIIDKLLPI